MHIPIDRRDDPRIAHFLGLRAQQTRKQREAPGGDLATIFIAEGDLVLERAIAHGYQLRSVLIGARRQKPLPSTVAASGADIFFANDEVLTEVTGRPELRDPIGCFVRPTPHDADSLLAKYSTFAVLENVNNPNNLGVIMRNAAALGIDAVLLDQRCADPLYRRAVRASMGQVFAIPHARLGDLPEDLERLRDVGVETIALTPSGLHEIRDVERPAKVAVLLGAEGPGLSTDVIAAADQQVKIAMHNSVDSLNVANAAAIAFHHFAER